MERWFEILHRRQQGQTKGKKPMAKPKQLLIGFAAGVAVLSMASEAFACSKFYGTMTVTGNGATPRTTTDPGAGTSTVIGDPGPSMGMCQLTPGATAKSSGGTVTVAVAVTPAGTCPASNLSPNTSYYVRWKSGAAFYATKSWPYQRRTQCMTLTVSNSGTMGTQTTDSSGALASATWNLPDLPINNASEDSGICVTDGTDGAMAPVQIVAV